MDTHINKEKRKKYPCFIINCDKSVLRKFELKSHIFTSHEEEYNRLDEEYPNMNFNEIYREIHLNKNLDFINFKVLECEENNTNNKKYKNNFDKNINLDLLEKSRNSEITQKENNLNNFSKDILNEKRKNNETLFW